MLFGKYILSTKRVLNLDSPELCTIIDAVRELVVKIRDLLNTDGQPERGLECLVIFYFPMMYSTVATYHIDKPLS